MKRPPFIETFLGERFQPLKPVLETIRIEDIAHALSNQCRFSGHTRVHYSVAEHSVRVARLLISWGQDEQTVLWGLLHDASEAYLVDLPTPLKSDPAIGDAYRRAEKRLMHAVCRAFELPLREPSSVRLADAVLLSTEVRDLMYGRPSHWDALVAKPIEEKIEPWGPFEAEREFLRMFRELTENPKEANMTTITKQVAA
jgi:hypothetical protein